MPRRHVRISQLNPPLPIARREFRSFPPVTPDRGPEPRSVRGKIHDRLVRFASRRWLAAYPRVKKQAGRVGLIRGLVVGLAWPIDRLDGDEIFSFPEVRQRIDEARLRMIVAGP